MHPATQRVADALAASGATGTIRTLDSSARTAQLAAEALGVPVGAIANSLIFDADGIPVLILTSGAHRVDTHMVAAELGLGTLKRASPEFVRAHTGQVIGGVAPVGHPQPITTVIDVALKDYRTIWAAAGHAHTVFPTTFAELCALTGGRPLAVAAEVA